MIFVHQDSEQAWKGKGRRAPSEVFVSQFMEYQSVVNVLKKHFGSNSDIMFIEKNIESASKRPLFMLLILTLFCLKKTIASISKPLLANDE